MIDAYVQRATYIKDQVYWSYCYPKRDVPILGSRSCVFELWLLPSALCVLARIVAESSSGSKLKLWILMPCFADIMSEGIHPQTELILLFSKILSKSSCKYLKIYTKKFSNRNLASTGQQRNTYALNVLRVRYVNSPIRHKDRHATQNYWLTCSQEEYIYVHGEWPRCYGGLRHGASLRPRVNMYLCGHFVGHFER